MHRWSAHLETSDCLTRLVAEIESREQRQRARTKESAKRLRNAIRSIVLDLFVAWKTDPELEVGLPLSNAAYSRSSRYRAVFLKYEGVVAAYRGLKDLDYVQEVRAGFNDPRTGIGRTTRVRATPKLISLLTDNSDLSISKISRRVGNDAAEIIVLRDENKKNVEYDDTVETIQMRAELERINDLLNCTWIDLYIPDAEWPELLSRTRAKAERDGDPYHGIDLSRRYLVRIFNHRNWELGGRFYGGWWQIIPSDYRRYITINGKHCVEVDYSGMHVALLYAQIGAELIGDAYDIGLPQVPRSIVKRTFQKLLNAKGRISVDPDFNEADCRISWAELRNRILDRHGPIAKYIGTGYGIRLQNLDAHVANQILVRMADMG